MTTSFNKLFALSFIITGALSLSANFAEAGCPHNQNQHKTKAEQASCHEAHGGQQQGGQQVVVTPKCGAGTSVEKGGCGAVPVNNHGQIEADIVLSEKDMTKLREKQGKIEAKRLKKIAKANEELAEELAKRRKDADKYYEKGEEIQARIDALKGKCDSDRELCKLYKKAEKHNRKEGRRGDHQFEIYEKYYTQKHAEKLAKINAEAEEDQNEALEKAGKPGFWARLGGGFKSAGKGIFVKTPRFIYERGKDVVWDGPKHVIKSIGGKLFRCGCEDGKTVTDCREVEVTRAVTRRQTDVAQGSTTVGQLPVTQVESNCQVFGACGEFDLPVSEGLPNLPESNNVSLTSVEDIPAAEVAAAPAAETAAPAGYFNMNVFKNIRFDAGSGQ